MTRVLPQRNQLLTHYSQTLNHLCRVREMIDWLMRNSCVDTDDRELFAGLASYEAADKLLSLIINGSNFTVKVFSGGLLVTEQHALYLAITLKGISRNIV